MNVIAIIYVTADKLQTNKFAGFFPANSRKFQKVKTESLKRLNLQSQAQFSLGTSKPFKKKDVGEGRVMLAQVQVRMTMRKLE